MAQQQEERIIGIDLGTTNSVVAVTEGGEPIVIPTPEGSNKTPSVVAFLDNGDVVVGEIARRQAATNPKRTISSIKRLMGRLMEDVEETGDVFPYDIVAHDDGILIDVDGMGYRPEQISALIIKRLKESAEAYLGEAIGKAVITVPANFDDLQRNATKQAAEMAGLEVVRLINEPTAAAMSYGLGKATDTEEVVAIYDFGGGTFDISLLEITGKTFEVLTSTGDSHLGGDDLDNILVEQVVREFEESHGVDLTKDPVTLRRLKEVAERSKCELSATSHSVMALPFIAYRDGQPLHLERTVERAEFEELVEPFVNRTIKCCKRALDEAGIPKKDITKVILVGGSTRIPLVQDAVEDFFGLSPFKGVNPDEVVAKGAATQAGVFEGNIQEVILLDVCPHSLGIEVKDGRFSRIIEKNATIPIKAAKTFTTTEANQAFVNIHVLQGEGADAAENRSLGKFTLTGIPQAAAGAPRIRVMFFVNADGVMEISANDMNTGANSSLTIVHSDLSDEERKRRQRKRSRSSRAPGAKPKRQRLAAGEGRPRTSGVEHERPMSGVTLKKGDSSSGVRPGPFSGEDDSSSSRGAPQADFAFVEGVGAAAPPPRQSAPAARDRHSPGQGIEAVDYSQVPVMYTRPAPPKEPVPLGGGSRSNQAVAKPPPAPPPKAPRAPAPSTEVEEPAPKWPEAIAFAHQAALENLEGPDALEAYAKAVDMLGKAPFAGQTGYHVTEMRAMLRLMQGQMEEGRAELAILRRDHIPTHGRYVLALHDLALKRFPVSGRVRRDRGLCFEALGELENASSDFEAASRLDPQASDVADLERLYQARLSQGEDPAVQFKLVKLYLKTNRVDDAIGLLSDLQKESAYETRALKILGLCHWQKNLHYLAWEKFKLLPVDDELKDILYRLGKDMESNDQLGHALGVYEYLAGADPKYLDVDARLKKLRYRIKLQKEEKEASSQAAGALTDSRFVILEEINRGSMGIIYKAKDKMLDEIVALKVLNDYLCSDPAAIERFKREARAAKKLSHPYIVRIHDMFEMGQKRLISMEYIDGVDLKRLLAEKSSFSEQMVVYYIMQIADALAYAHKINIIHRDIKPANIMITKANMVKITDFGIAKILKGDDSTKSGTAVIGTPLYMSPEQITGEGVDARSDIYSLGIMMYEMLSGNPPFYLGNIEYHHIHTAPPPLPERLTPAVRNVIMKCVEKDPGARFQSVDDIMVALRSALPAA